MDSAQQAGTSVFGIFVMFFIIMHMFFANFDNLTSFANFDIFLLISFFSVKFSKLCFC